MQRVVRAAIVLVLLTGALATRAVGATARLTHVSVEEIGSETVVTLAVEGGVGEPSLQMLPDHRLVIDLQGVVPVSSSHDV